MDVRDTIYINGAWVPSSGSGTLELRYIRPWEKSAPAARIFKIKFTVP